MVKLLKKGEKIFIELPAGFPTENLKAVILDKDIFVVTTEDAIKRLLRKQLWYVLRSKVKKNLESVKNLNEGEAYWIIESEEMAAAFSSAHATEIKKGWLLGVRSFDGKYYVVRSDVYQALLPKILEIVKKAPASPEDIERSAGIKKELAKAILEVAREEGIVYELPGGKYKYTG